MICKLFVDFAVMIFSGAIKLLNVFSLPLDMIKTLSSITSYGSFVVGDDLILIFCGCVMFWLSFKASVGILKFVWELLPLT